MEICVYAHTYCMLCVCTYMYISIHNICVYMIEYIYLYIEYSIYSSIKTHRTFYMYIYTQCMHTHMYVCIHIYIYTRQLLSKYIYIASTPYILVTKKRVLDI